MQCHQRPRSSWLSLLQILYIDLLAYTSLFSMFAGLAIFFNILTWKTREFDLNFAYQKFYSLLNQLVFLCFGIESATFKGVNTSVRGLESILCNRAEFIIEHVLHKSKLLWLLNSCNATRDLEVAGYLYFRSYISIFWLILACFLCLQV